MVEIRSQVNGDLSKCVTPTGKLCRFASLNNDGSVVCKVARVVNRVNYLDVVFKKGSPDTTDGRIASVIKQSMDIFATVGPSPYSAIKCVQGYGESLPKGWEVVVAKAIVKSSKWKKKQSLNSTH